MSKQSTKFEDLCDWEKEDSQIDILGDSCVYFMKDKGCKDWCDIGEEYRILNNKMFSCDIEGFSPINSLATGAIAASWDKAMETIELMLGVEAGVITDIVCDYVSSGEKGKGQAVTDLAVVIKRRGDV